MATKTRWNFRAKEWEKAVVDTISKRQTDLLVSYAENEISNIAEEFQKNVIWQLDIKSTGNLLDSLCWGVFYNNRLSKMGYYRQAMAIEDSYLHELSKSGKISVNGHFLAQQFLAQYKPTLEKGWEVVFGCLAPYEAYWEQGHYNVMLKTQVQFAAMTQRYDVIKQELSPLCKVDILITVPN